MHKPRRRELALILLICIIPFIGWASIGLARDGHVSLSTFLYPAIGSAIFISLHFALRWLAPKSDPLLLPTVAALSFIGLTMIYRLDVHMARLQFYWMMVGAAFFVLVLMLLKDCTSLRRYPYIIALAAVALLAVTMIFGRTRNGARLWLQIGPLSYQPSEMAKLLLAIFFAAYLADKRELLARTGRRVGGFIVPPMKYFGPLLVMWGLSLLLLIFQRDLGSSLIFFSMFLAVLYVSTSRMVFVVVGIILFLVGAMFCYAGLPYVRNRVTIWLHPLSPELIQDESYQMAQSMFSIAEGGLTGRGISRGSPGYIPDVETDFIFSAIAEELGLAGAIALVLLFLMLAARGMKIAMDSEDDFGKLLATGLTAVLTIQAFVIMGGATRLIPLTGVTLPFVSYGGSSILSNFILIALLIKVSERQEMVFPADARQERIRQARERVARKAGDGWTEVTRSG